MAAIAFLGVVLSLVHPARADDAASWRAWQREVQAAVTGVQLALIGCAPPSSRAGDARLARPLVLWVDAGGDVELVAQAGWRPVVGACVVRVLRAGLLPPPPAPEAYGLTVLAVDTAPQVAFALSRPVTGHSAGWGLHAVEALVDRARFDRCFHVSKTDTPPPRMFVDLTVDAGGNFVVAPPNDAEPDAARRCVDQAIEALPPLAAMPAAPHRLSIWPEAPHGSVAWPHAATGAITIAPLWLLMERAAQERGGTEVARCLGPDASSASVHVLLRAGPAGVEAVWARAGRADATTTACVAESIVAVDVPKSPGKILAFYTVTLRKGEAATSTAPRFYVAATPEWPAEVVVAALSPRPKFVAGAYLAVGEPSGDLVVADFGWPHVQVLPAPRHALIAARAQLSQATVDTVVDEVRAHFAECVGADAFLATTVEADGNLNAAATLTGVEGAELRGCVARRALGATVTPPGVQVMLLLHPLVQ